MEQGNKYILNSFVVGPLEVNAYCLASSATKDACLIDPGASPGKMLAFLARNKLNLKFIINTHGHGDHIAANGSFNVPIYIHRLDADFLTNSKKNMSSFYFFSISSPKASRLLEDNDKIILGDLELNIIHTPGHTPGSVSIKADNILFTGDALFRGSIGRTDFEYGDEALLLRSIKERLMVMNDATLVYPGHGGPSTIGEERRANPFLA